MIDGKTSCISAEPWVEKEGVGYSGNDNKVYE